jgi:hypothetical protein
VRATVLVLGLLGCGRIGFAPLAEDDPAEPTRYRDVVLEDAPVAYWRLADTDGVARDELGHADGTYSGACRPAVAGALTADADRAAGFDGATCQIVVPDRFGFPGTAAFSIEVWTSLAATTGWQHFFMSERRDADNPIDGYSLLSSPGGVYFERVANRNNRSAGSYAMPGGVFVHLVGVYDGAQVSLYADGALIDSTAATASIAAFSGAPVIGASSAGIGFVGGVLDELAIYDHALAPERIQLHHEIGQFGPR